MVQAEGDIEGWVAVPGAASEPGETKYSWRHTQGAGFEDGQGAMTRFGCLNAVVDAVHAHIQPGATLFRMGIVPAQTGHGQRKVTNSVHKLFQFALNAILPGLKSLQMFKQQIFD